MPFGRELQLERERRGVPLERVADETKVSAKYLRALELDDFNSLPGGVFQRGMVRSYCRSLGLDEQEWLGRFQSSGHGGPGELDWTEFAENVKRTRTQSGRSMRPRWFVVMLMVSAFAGIGWLAWRYILKPRFAVQSSISSVLGEAATVQRSNVPVEK